MSQPQEPATGQLISLEPTDPWDVWVRRLNKIFAVTMLGGKFRIMRWVDDPLSSELTIVEFMSQTDFKLLLSNRRIVIDENSFLVATRWLSDRNRREYIGGVAFAPGIKLPDTIYNLWSGFAFNPKAGDVEIFLLFVQKVICADNEIQFNFVIAWLADAVQNPSSRPGTALVLRGGQGVGKSFFAETFGQLYGRHFLELNNPRHLTGNFNRHLMDKAVVFADEGSFGGKSTQSTLKNLVTSPTLLVEPKGVDAFERKNCLRIIIAGNDKHIINAAGDERRYLVLDVSHIHKEDHEYFGALACWRENGGLEALLYFFQKYDTSKVNLRMAPRTSALRDIKIASLPKLEKWWLDRLMAGEPLAGREWDEFIPISDMHADYTTETGFRWDRSMETEFGIHLAQLVPNLRRSRRMVGMNRKYGYDLPPLEECRAEFERHIGHKVDWPGVEEDV